MKITKITTDDKGIYHVEFTPYWIERIFNIKPKVKKYKDSGKVFALSNEPVYYTQDGQTLDVLSKIGKRINQYRRSWQ